MKIHLKGTHTVELQKEHDTLVGSYLTCQKASFPLIPPLSWPAYQVFERQKRYCGLSVRYEYKLIVNPKHLYSGWHRELRQRTLSWVVHVRSCIHIRRSIIYFEDSGANSPPWTPPSWGLWAIMLKAGCSDKLKFTSCLFWYKGCIHEAASACLEYQPAAPCYVCFIADERVFNGGVYEEEPSVRATLCLLPPPPASDFLCKDWIGEIIF